MFAQVTSFIREQFQTKDFIPLHAPVFNGNEEKYVLETIDSTFVSSVGSYVDLSEEMLAEYCKIKTAVAVVNGTAGLHVGLQVAGVSSGDEVITQALTFVATVNAISYVGAEPIFLDVDLDTMGLSPSAVESFLEENAEIKETGTYNKITGKKISACVPMHTFGFPVHLSDLLRVCKKWKIPVVEDSAESLGSLYKNKHTGSFGKIGVFSFNGNKIVTAGAGGMIVTNDVELGKESKHLTTTAKISHPFEYFHDRTGYNFRMPNLNAALLCAQIERIESFVRDKRELAMKYKNFFDTIDIKFRIEPKGSRANYWLMCVELENINERNSFLRYTNDKKVMTRPIWTLMYKLPMYKHCFRDAQINSKFLEERIVNIPSSVRI